MSATEWRGPSDDPDRTAERIYSMHRNEAHVKICTLGRASVKTSSNALQATHYRYDGDIKMDQWFDDRGRWVKVSFKGSDGSTIEYVLQE